MKKLFITLITIATLSPGIKAQSGFEQALLGSSKDASNLVEAYFAPGMEGLINSMNNGWYHTAKVHKKFGFDISIGLNAAFIGADKETFNVLNALGNNSSITSNSTTASTFAGPEQETQYFVNLSNVQITEPNGNTITTDLSTSFSFPGGITEDLPVKAMPAPAVQLTVGLPFKLDAMIRFLPNIDFGDDGGKVGMYGIGLKKEITDWFGPMEKTPLHVSILAAYTSLNLDYQFGNQNDGGPLIIENGGAEFGLSAFTVQAIASLNFPIINIYGGLGYNSGNADLRMTGNYKGIYSYTNSLGQTAQTSPLDLEAPSLSFESSGFRSTIGARLSLGFFKIFGDYTFQDYNTANLGIAFSIR